MRILFVADVRSHNTLGWIRQWIERGEEVHLISTYSCDPPPGLSSFHIIPVAFAAFAGGGQSTPKSSVPGVPIQGRSRKLRQTFQSLRYLLGPFSLPFYLPGFHKIVTQIQPDIVHALRIPFEGMLALGTPPGIKLVVSIWGNDLTYHSHRSSLMQWITRRVLQRADGLMADTKRDIRLGIDQGFPADRPTLTVPGAGGIRLLELESTSTAALATGVLDEISQQVSLVVNPRGHRPGSVRNDIFLKAIPLVVQKVPQVLFICPSLAGNIEAERLVSELGIAGYVRIWSKLPQADLWALYRRASLYVSPSVHDGTPNSLLEAMACGCFPILGDIESMKEWITHGHNGLLADANDVTELANAMIAGLSDPDLRARAAKENAAIISSRADYVNCMAQAAAFYQELLSD